MNNPDWQALCIFLNTRLAAARSLVRALLRADRTRFRLPALHIGIIRRFGAMCGKEAERTVTRTSALLGLIAFLCVGVPLLSLLSGFVPDREGLEMRRTANTKALAPFPEERTPDGARTGEDGGWVYRSAISWEERGTVRHTKSGTRGELVAFTENGIALLTAAGARTLEPGADAAPLHAQSSDEGLFLFAASPPAQYGEALDAAGQPLRWIVARAQSARATFNDLPLSGQKSVSPGLAALTERPGEGGQLFNRAQRYKALVERFAERYKIKTELIYAIIHNESNFQPGVVSSRRAMGLMQLLPSTAGGEVHKFLHGQTSDLDDETLMDPENNLRYGIAYLHLLLTRHFGEVEHPESREFCAIAAYNLGPNALLNTFSRDRDDAVAAINSLSPQEVYERLAENLPVRETRNFIARVLNSKKEFTDFQ
jgi:membrane-bound lytic murein transglycosylase C